MNNQDDNSNLQNNGSLHNKFFPTDFNLNEENKQVNSVTGNNISNEIINKKSWNVGYHKSRKNEPEVLNLLDDEPINIMNKVNTKVYDTTQNNLNNQSVNQVNQSSIVKMDMDNTQNMNNNQNPNLVQDNSWVNNQPLSAIALGASTPELGNTPKEVVTENIFINKNIPDKPVEEQNNLNINTPQFNISSILEEQRPVLDIPALNRDFVGDAYQKITMSPFSFSAFIFSYVYFIYRKLIILGIITFILEYMILFIVPTPISYIAFIVFRIIISLCINQIYLKTSEIKVKSLIKHNEKDDQYKLSNKCKKNGGTNFPFALLFLIISSLLIYFSATKLFPESFLNKYVSYIKIDNNSKDIDEKKFDGKLEIDDYSILDLYNIEIPDLFIKEETNYVYKLNDSNCSFSFNAIKGYSNGEKLIKDLALYNNVEMADSLKNNNIEWYNFDIENSKSRTYYRGTTINDRAILFQYNIGLDNDSNICDTFYVSIFSSISLKE